MLSHDGELSHPLLDSIHHENAGLIIRLRAVHHGCIAVGHPSVTFHEYPFACSKADRFRWPVQPGEKVAMDAKVNSKSVDVLLGDNSEYDKVDSS
jgi:hypothetical protein